MNDFFKHIIIIEGSLPTAAIAHVLETLLDCEIYPLAEDELNTKWDIPNDSLLILTQDQIPHLATLRLQEYPWAVLTLSNSTYAQTKTQYPILNIAQHSHGGCDFPWQLTDILEVATHLKPLHWSTLDRLIHQLQTSGDEIIAHIKKQFKNPDQRQAIAKIETALVKIRQNTIAACHSAIAIDGKTAQIQQHFTQVIVEMHQQQSITTELQQKLCSILTQWNDRVMSTGEGLGKLNQP